MSQTLVIRRSNAAVQEEVSAYSSLFDDSSAVQKREDQYKTLVANYYSLSTDFFEYGWGQSFHFANRFRGETLAESIQRHESYLALKMQIQPGQKVLDLGCGVGGPLRRIAHLTGAHITGVTISEYQIQRAKQIGTCVRLLTMLTCTADRLSRRAGQLPVRSVRLHATAVRRQVVRSYLHHRSGMPRAR